MENTQPFKVRLKSADVYRGLVMFLMMAEVWDLQKVSEKIPGSGFWSFLAWHQSHVAWVGCSLHDMIQPSFTFLVGVVLPYSVANQGPITHLNIGRALKRSLILILLGVFLRSTHAEITNWTFEDTLSQIGLGYTFLYILAFYSQKIQIIATATLLIIYWLAFALYPLPGAGFDYSVTAVTANWEHNLSGFMAHWNKNTNLAWAFDRWFLNLFPRESLFQNNRGGYATLSFIPTLGTMLLGLQAGNILKSKITESEKIKKFLIWAIGLIISSLIIHFAGICPIVKRIWTPNWVLFSGGICFLFLTFFYWLVDCRQVQKPFNWLKVIGMNSIAAYVLAHMVTGFIENSVKIHFGKDIFKMFGENYETLVSGSVILLFLWLILYWLYKKNLFIRI